MPTTDDQRRWRTPALALGALACLLGWSLWPCRETFELSGIVRPRFERLVSVVPTESGAVCRLRTERLQDVRSGDVLLEYVPMAKAAFLSYSSPTRPGQPAKAEPEPQWSIEVDRARIARIEAARRWSDRVRARGRDARQWEHELADRLVQLAFFTGDLERHGARQRENARQGHEAANAIYVFDEQRGERVVADHGQPLASPSSGVLYSLWVQPGMQFNGAPTPDLPAPPPGGPPVVALAVGGAPPVAEIVPSGAMLEVLALLPVPPRSLIRSEGWRAQVSVGGLNETARGAVTMIEIGEVPIARDDAKLAAPELPVGRECVFARLSLAGGGPAELDAPVRVRMVSPARPRAWFWLAASPRE